MHEEESNWDALASDLGLEPAPKPALPPPAERRALEPPPSIQPIVREEVVEVIPARVAEIELKVTSVTDVVESPTADESVVEDAVDVLDDEAPESSEAAAGEEPGEGEGKGRRRRRRRRRKKGGPETAAADGVAPAPLDETTEIDVLAFPSADEEEPADELPAEIDEGDEPEESDDEVEEIIPAVALAEEGEEESAEPLPEWKVTAWTDLVATLYRPQDR